jgi:hypothetical protein
MPKLRYVAKNFRPKSLGLITKCNDIILAYQAQGLDLTLRQLYYQLVSRDIIPNNAKEYNNLGATIGDARLAGLVDWEAITDRTRNLRNLSHWTTPESIIETCARTFQLNLWAKQENYVEVWIEKDALVGVIEGVCEELDVPHFSCRGYTSLSEMWAAGMRLIYQAKQQKNITILHLGDHDPSGIDMTRDIRDRLEMFMCQHKARLNVNRIALNMPQVEQYNPPPNFAKATDARFRSYQEEFGDDCWELDALEPTVMIDLIRTEVTALIDDEKWQESVDEQREHRRNLQNISDRYDDVIEYVNDGGQA